MPSRRRVRADAGLARAAEDDLVDRERVDAAPLQRRRRAGGAELRRRERGEAAAELSDRRPHGRGDVDGLVQLWHSFLTVSWYVCTAFNKSFFPLFLAGPCASVIEPGPKSSGLPSAVSHGTSVLNATTFDGIPGGTVMNCGPLPRDSGSAPRD